MRRGFNCLYHEHARTDTRAHIYISKNAINTYTHSHTLAVVLSTKSSARYCQLNASISRCASLKQVGPLTQKDFKRRQYNHKRVLTKNKYNAH